MFFSPSWLSVNPPGPLNHVRLRPKVCPIFAWDELTRINSPPRGVRPMKTSLSASSVPVNPRCTLCPAPLGLRQSSCRGRYSDALGHSVPRAGLAVELGRLPTYSARNRPPSLTPSLVECHFSSQHQSPGTNFLLIYNRAVASPSGRALPSMIRDYRAADLVSESMPIRFRSEPALLSMSPVAREYKYTP